MKKQIVRERMLLLRGQLDDRSYVRLSQQAQQRLMTTASFQRAKTLALYSPIRHEVATEQIFFAARAAEKQVFYPRVVGEELEFCEVSSATDLVAGAFGVAEPSGGSMVRADELDLIVVPGVAFSPDGFRLGYGRGFYDRQLAGRPPTTVAVGLGFDLQLVDSLPVEEHDQQLDCVVTETRFIPCRA
jgi:5-formyltetrahydrofolate cyclo-ligase